jgi:hypothetical protein
MTSRTLRLTHRLLRIAAQEDREINPSSLRLGLVGWEGSGTDRSMLRWAGDYLSSTEERSYDRFDQESKWGTATNYDADIAERWEDADKDFINLAQGRDFLEESGTYDVVILCWIFGPTTYRGTEGVLNVSKKHTPEEWKARLVATGAKYIFAFGNKTEVGGHYLGSIPGYRTTTLSPSATVYDRK